MAGQPVHHQYTASSGACGWQAHQCDLAGSASLPAGSPTALAMHKNGGASTASLGTTRPLRKAPALGALRWDHVRTAALPTAMLLVLLACSGILSLHVVRVMLTLWCCCRVRPVWHEHC